MDKTIYYNNLYDYYGELLTDKQQEYYEDYYFNDLSLAEIAENNEVSRNAVHNQLKIAIEKLEFYEEKLKLYEKRLKITKIIDKVDIELKNKIEELI
jgi:predicted DNA-binding protein YlxM (UPF0122 family)